MRQENFAPPEVSRIVLKRLFDKAFSSVEIFRFIKDVENIIDDDGKITLPETIQKLETLGWGKESIDPRILELIPLLPQNNPIRGSEDKISYGK